MTKTPGVDSHQIKMNNCRFVVNDLSCTKMTRPKRGDPGLGSTEGPDEVTAANQGWNPG